MSGTTDTMIRLPDGLLRRLLQISLSGVSGPGSMRRRQRIAVRMAGLLHSHGEDLPDATVLFVTSTIIEALNSCSEGDDPALRSGFGMDPRGSICWTPQALARTLGFELKTGLRRLKSWRQRGLGPKFIKLGDSPQSPVLYPIKSTLEWIESQPVGGN